MTCQENTLAGGRRCPLLGRAAAVAAEQADGSPRRRASSTAEALALNFLAAAPAFCRNLLLLLIIGTSVAVAVLRLPAGDTTKPYSNNGACF